MTQPIIFRTCIFISLVLLISLTAYSVSTTSKNEKKGIDISAISTDIKHARSGTVAIVATGTRELLDAFVEWCKEGPPRARVKDVEVKEIPLQHFGSFTIERR